MKLSTFFSLIITILLSVNALKAQLVISQAFDFAVGDSFIYRDSLYNSFSFTLIKTTLRSVVITSKWRDANAIFYQRNTKSVEKSAYQAWNGTGIYRQFPPSAFVFDTLTTTAIDTLVVTDLDSSVTYRIKPCDSLLTPWGVCTSQDTAFEISYGSNRKSIKQGCNTLGGCFYYFDSLVGMGHGCGGNLFYFERYAKGLGRVVKIDYSRISGYKYAITELIQYSKGGERWQKFLPVVSTKVSVVDTALIPIQLSPNPSKDVLIVESKSVFDNVKIVTTTGKIVFDKKNIKTSIETIHLHDLPNGLYIVQIFEGIKLIGVSKCMIVH